MYLVEGLLLSERARHDVVQPIHVLHVHRCQGLQYTANAAAISSCVSKVWIRYER